MAAEGELIDRFFAFYAEDDPDRRRQEGERLLTDDAEFLGLQVQAHGRDEVVATFRGEGERLVRTGDVLRQPSGWLFTTWKVVRPDGSTATADDGEPYAGPVVFEVTTDGQIRRAVPFRQKASG